MMIGSALGFMVTSVYAYKCVSADLQKHRLIWLQLDFINLSVH